MSAFAAALTRTYPIGDYFTVTLTAPARAAGDDIWAAVEWKPERPHALSDLDLAEFRDARSQFLHELRDVLGEALDAWAPAPGGDLVQVESLVDPLHPSADLRSAPWFVM